MIIIYKAGINLIIKQKSFIKFRNVLASMNGMEGTAFQTFNYIPIKNYDECIQNVDKDPQPLNLLGHFENIVPCGNPDFYGWFVHEEQSPEESSNEESLLQPPNEAIPQLPPLVSFQHYQQVQQAWGNWYRYCQWQCQVPPPVEEVKPIMESQKIAESVTEEHPKEPMSPVKGKKGCTCKKSSCQKKYCECYRSGNQCSPSCKCADCLNNEENQSSITNKKVKVQ